MKLCGKIMLCAAVCGGFLAIGTIGRANELNNLEQLPPPSVLAPGARSPSDAAPSAAAPSVAVPSAAAPSAAMPTASGCGCCCPCIEYRHCGRPICCCDCNCNAPPEIKTVLQVKNPATCCMVAIPVCLPGCCTGEPCVTGHLGVLGRGTVRFYYCCGVHVTVTFKACGDILVTYVHA